MKNLTFHIVGLTHNDVKGKFTFIFTFYEHRMLPVTFVIVSSFTFYPFTFKRK